MITIRMVVSLALMSFSGLKCGKFWWEWAKQKPFLNDDQWKAFHSPKTHLWFIQYDQVLVKPVEKNIFIPGYISKIDDFSLKVICASDKVISAQLRVLLRAWSDKDKERDARILAADMLEMLKGASSERIKILTKRVDTLLVDNNITLDPEYWPAMAIYTFCGESNVEAVKFLVERIDTQKKEAMLKRIYDEGTVLTYVLKAYNFNDESKKLVRYLIDQGAELNPSKKTSKFRKLSPIMVSIANESCPLEIIQLLIEKGADINFEEPDGYEAFVKYDRPIILAMRLDRFDVALFLMKKGADFSNVNTKGESVADFMKQKEVKIPKQTWVSMRKIMVPQFIIWLIERFPKNDLSNHKIFKNFYQDVSDRLAELDAYLKEFQELTNPDTVARFLNEERHLEWRGSVFDGTLLQWAVLDNNYPDACERLVKKLLEAGADKDLKNGNGKTAYDYAKTDAMKKLLNPS